MVNLVDTVALSKQICKQPIECELAYATPNNFVGRIIAGYHPDALDICLLTPKAAQALCAVQNHLLDHHGYGLFVYDSYRPKRAVQDFMAWANLPSANAFESKRKKLHFPHIEKTQLFELGYVSKDSNHCYANTVDLVLIDAKTKKFLDMGAIFDYMDVMSHLTATAEQIGVEAYQHRLILVEAMTRFGFVPYEKEFWHYCHGGREGSEVAGPLDVEITASLRGVGC